MMQQEVYTPKTVKTDLPIKICVPTRDPQHYQAILDLRKQVFVQEQKVPLELEVDSLDPKAVHLYLSEGEKLVACLRIYSKEPGCINIGRLCVDKDFRNKGYASKLIKSAIDFGKNNGFSKATLAAQYASKDFYEKLGFKEKGDVFDDAGLPHIQMDLNLNSGTFPARKLGYPLNGSVAQELQFDQLRSNVAYGIVTGLINIGLVQSANLLEYQSEIYHLLSIPKEKSHGDLALPAFAISKKLGINPVEFAKRVAEEVPLTFAQSIENIGPFINFRLNKKFVNDQILTPIISEDYFSRQLLFMPPQIMLEFSQPNTHKELHVGHMRNICLGGSLALTFKYVGVPTVTSTFPGDVGTHVAKCLWYLKNHNQEPVPESKKGVWLGALYTKANTQIEAEAETPESEKTAKILTQILRELEQQKGEYYELWKETREWSIDQMEEAYNWSGIKFDTWYWESDVDSASVNLVKDLYAQGKLVSSEGAVGMDLTEDNLGFCMLLKSDGNGMYSSKDLYLAKKKFDDHQLDKSIYLVDLRQAHHFKQIFKVLDKLGYEHAGDCFHLPYNFVELPDGAMSSRKGNIVPISSLINGMRDYITTSFLNKYSEEWPKDEILKTADLIAAGAIKYAMNRYEPSSKVVFDLEEWLKLDGESGPYIQYCSVRISSLLKKAESIGIKPYFNQERMTDEEKLILFKLNEFNAMTLEVCQTFKTNHICTYLHELSKMFNSYYANNRVVSEDLELSGHRIMFSQAVSKTLNQGLSLLGITVPDRM